MIAQPTPSEIRYSAACVLENLVDGKLYLAHGRYAHEWRTSVVQEGFEGKAVFAAAHEVYADVSCVLGATIGRPGLAITGGISGKGRPSWTEGTAIVGAQSLGAAPRLRFADVGDYGGIPWGVDLIAGDRVAFARSAVPGALAAFDMTSLAFAPTSPNGGRSVVVVPDGAVTLEQAHDGIALVHDDGTFVPWRAPTAKTRRIEQLSFDATSGDTVVWVECDAREPWNAELWTARYAADPAQVVARRMGRLPASTPYCATGALVNDRVIAVVVAPDRAAIHRVSDGAGWLVHGDLGQRLRWPVWVDRDEIVVQAEYASGPPRNQLRVHREGLGAPTLQLER